MVPYVVSLMPKIIDLRAREILDSRGNPTLEVDCWVEGHIMGRSSVPSGASKGLNEAIELRDNDSKRYLGKGVLEAVDLVNTTLREELRGCLVTSQQVLDKRLCELDGTPTKSRLGANTLLGVSLAAAKAAAQVRGKPFYAYIQEIFGGVDFFMPVPLMNVLNGGLHADNSLDIQEFMIAPIGAPSFKEALRMGAEVFHHLKRILKEKNLNSNVGDEGGFAPSLPSNRAALDLLMGAISRAGYKAGQDIWLALDPAASSFFENGAYHFKSEQAKRKSSEELIRWYEELVRQYPIFSIEDGLAEEDFEGWKKLTQVLGRKVQLVGDDLFVTQSARLQKGIEEKMGNAILIKPNQVGTLTETLDCIQLAKEKGFATIISHRSGETEETTIADLAVGTSAGQIKAGSLSRSERLVKYNQLLRIEEELEPKANYYGRGALKK